MIWIEKLILKYSIMILFLAFIVIIAIAVIIISKSNVREKNSKEESTKHTQNYNDAIRNITIEVPEKSSTGIGKYLILDTETTGLPEKSRIFKPKDIEFWPYVVEIAWILVDEDGLLVDGEDAILKQKTSIPLSASNIHKITTARMMEEGKDPTQIYDSLLSQLQKCEMIIAHNVRFDIEVLKADLFRHGFDYRILDDKNTYCTMEKGKEFCITYSNRGARKNPRLEELFGELYYNNKYMSILNAHSAFNDVLVTYKCFMKMRDLDAPYPIELRTSIVEKDKSYDEEFVSKCVEKIDSKIFEGKTFVITGGFKYFSRDDLTEILVRLGGLKRGSISSKTNIVIVGNNAGPTKLEKIEEQKKLRDDIMVLKEDDILEMMK